MIFCQIMYPNVFLLFQFNEAVGLTPAMKMLSSIDLERIYHAQQTGNKDLAKELTENLNQNYLETFADKINDEFQKVFKAHRNRIGRPGAGLDQNLLPQYWEHCDPRWNLIIEQDEYQEKLPEGTGTIPDVCSKENLFKILNSLPNNKSPGKSKIPYEAYKYADD